MTDETFDLIQRNIVSPDTIEWRIGSPNVKQHETVYPTIRFQPGDEVTIVDAGGCVQTGGSGKTWKRYVDPQGDNTDRLYHGLVKIPGVHQNLVRIKDVVGQAFTIPSNADPNQLVLSLGYEDDDYGNNGYYLHDDGTGDQCKDTGPAWVALHAKSRTLQVQVAPTSILTANSTSTNPSTPTLPPPTGDDWAARVCGYGTVLQDDPPAFAWTQVLDPANEFDNPPIGVTGHALLPQLASSDMPFTHPFGNDWECFIAPDPEYQRFLSPGNNGAVWNTSFESGSKRQPTSNDTPDTLYNGSPVNVSGFVSSIKPECSIRTEGVAHSGSTALMYSGTANGGSSTFCYFKVFDFDEFEIKAETKLTYWIYPQQDNGRYVAVDFLCKDGTTLRDSGAVDQFDRSVHPAAGHGGEIPLNTWSEIDCNVGQWLEGKKIKKIWVAFDRSGSTGQFRGYIDDIIFSEKNDLRVAKEHAKDLNDIFRLPLPEQYSQGVLSVESDAGLVPEQFRAEDGDRVAVLGRWVVDSGHEYHCEIHPPLLFARAKAVSAQETHSTIIGRPYLVGQKFTKDGAPLRQHLINELITAANPIPGWGSFRIEAHPIIMRPFVGTPSMTYSVRPPSGAPSSGTVLMVRFHFTVRSGVDVRLQQVDAQTVQVSVTLRADQYTMPNLPLKHDRDVSLDELTSDAGWSPSDRRWFKTKLDVLASIFAPAALVALNQDLRTDRFDAPVAQSSTDAQITTTPIAQLPQNVPVGTVDDSQPFPIYGWLDVYWGQSLRAFLRGHGISPTQGLRSLHVRSVRALLAQG